MNISTGFYLKGELVMDIKLILKNYFKTNFLTETLTLIALILAFFTDYSKYFAMLFLIRCFKVIGYSQSINDRFNFISIFFI